ncbi:hypothetical protein RCC89_12000 [Cytophagaceae bacterium ABcell3]|nr:hypothetical protein RCC89_12000 [Cytophagaceae bacterium ABcell3]
MRISGITYKHNKIEDQNTFNALPEQLQIFLEQINGVVAYKGGLHIRGCCHSPSWHSLDEAWTGKNAFWKHYPEILDTDIPFGQDCMGDQFLLRNDNVIKLFSETGELEELRVDFKNFLQKSEEDPLNFLGMHPLLNYEMEKGSLEPWQLLKASPPFCFQKPGVKLEAVSAEEQIAYLSKLYKEIKKSNGDDQIDFLVS